VYGSPIRAFWVLCIAKYWYGENSAANPNFKKSFLTFSKSRYWSKNTLSVFQKNPKFFFFKAKNPLSWQA
jgi:hypothetical protein